MYRVLIVEDEDIIRKGIAYTMDWMSMDCVIAGEAANGKEGVEKILELRPDIVVADIMMPYMNGIEMIRSTKDQVPYKSILLTSYAEFSYAKQAIDLKVSDYLMKPVEEEEIRKAIEKVTGDIRKEKEIARICERHAAEFSMQEFYKKAEMDNPYVKKTLEITEKEYANKISVESIADQLGVSASYLSRKFKQITGLTYLDFLNKYRISQAIRLMETGQYKVYEISEKTGFSDYKHFNVVFKRYTNQSPTEFMK